jgi:uncharacterized RDD family membrane protein YckC
MHGRAAYDRAMGDTALLITCLLMMAGTDPLPAASSDDHVWFVVQTPKPAERVELRHWAPGERGPYYTSGLTLSVGEPDDVEAMAAWDNQLWLVFAPTTEKASHRETFTVLVYRSPDLGVWYEDPPDRLRAVPFLPGTGTLAGLAATADGPVALLAGAKGMTLLQLSSEGWKELPLPDHLGPGPWRLGAAGADGSCLVLVRTPPHPGGPSPQHRLLGPGTWSSSEVNLGAGSLRRLTRVGPNPVVVTVAPGGESVEIAYLRPGLLLPLARIAPPPGRWAVAGTRAGPALLEQTAQGDVALARIDAISGAVGPRQTLTPQPLMAGRVLYRPLLLALGITAVVVVALFGSAASAAVVLPPGTVVASPLSRLGAVAVDVGASAVVTLVIFRCPPADLLWWPLWTASLAESVPFLSMIGLTVVHGTISELIFARTLGKKVAAIAVVDADGARPTARAIVVRNALKAIVLLIPVLAVFALFNPHVQGLGDQVARTVVVSTRRAVEDNGAHDR